MSIHSVTVPGSTGRAFPEIFSEVPLIQRNHDDLYITTTEKGGEDVIGTASKMPETAGKVLLFASGMFGLNLASAAEGVEYLISVDRSQKLPLLWEGIKKIVAGCTREEAIEKIHNFIVDNADSFFKENCSCCTKQMKAKKEVLDSQKEIDKKISWLSSDERYARIQKIFNENKFAFVRADLCDENAMGAIANALEENKLSLKGIYLSNVSEYAEIDGKFDLFKKSISRLKPASTPETFVVDTAVRGWIEAAQQTVPLRQQLRKGFYETSPEEFFLPMSKPAHGHPPFGGGMPFPPARITIQIVVPAELAGRGVMLDPGQLMNLLGFFQ